MSERIPSAIGAGGTVTPWSQPPESPRGAPAGAPPDPTRAAGGAPPLAGTEVSGQQPLNDSAGIYEQAATADKYALGGRLAGSVQAEGFTALDRMRQPLGQEQAPQLPVSMDDALANVSIGAVPHTPDGEQHGGAVAPPPALGGQRLGLAEGAVVRPPVVPGGEGEKLGHMPGLGEEFGAGLQVGHGQELGHLTPGTIGESEGWFGKGGPDQAGFDTGTFRPDLGLASGSNPFGGGAVGPHVVFPGDGVASTTGECGEGSMPATGGESTDAGGGGTPEAGSATGGAEGGGSGGTSFGSTVESMTGGGKPTEFADGGGLTWDVGGGVSIGGGGGTIAGIAAGGGTVAGDNGATAESFGVKGLPGGYQVIFGVKWDAEDGCGRQGPELVLRGTSKGTPEPTNPDDILTGPHGDDPDGEAGGLGGHVGPDNRDNPWTPDGDPSPVDGAGWSGGTLQPSNYDNPMDNPMFVKSKEGPFANPDPTVGNNNLGE
ncbi:MAG: hypothetical protein HYV63_16155 [Candidatus Schekmanbacteria bacterium]|nr:hypothetical protein [Candidatus Schekmanbacteria bacterium]